MVSVNEPFSLSLLYDSSTSVWIITDSSIPGLVAEASTLQELVNKLDILIPELIRLNQPHTISWDSIRDEVLSDPETLKEYTALGPEFKAYKRLLNWEYNHIDEYDIKPDS